MPSQIEHRVERLENSMGAGSGRVAVVFEDDDRPMPEAETVIHVRFVEPGEDCHDDQEAR